MTTGIGVGKIITEVVDRVVRVYQPSKVILFGSHAYGEPTEDSDIDLLVVTDRDLSPEEPYKIRRQFLRDFRVPVQLICVSEKEFAETKDVIGGVTYLASKYGKVLYEKS